MDEDGVDIDRAILRGLLKGLQRPLGVLYSTLCSIKLQVQLLRSKRWPVGNVGSKGIISNW